MKYFVAVCVVVVVVGVEIKGVRVETEIELLQIGVSSVKLKSSIVCASSVRFVLRLYLSSLEKKEVEEKKTLS